MSFLNILVTGANRGIGLEFIRQLLSLNPPPKNLIATTRSNSEELNQLKAANNNNLYLLNYDASNFDSYASFASQVQQIVGDEGLDLLINNAGMLVRGNLDLVTVEEMMTNFEINAVGPLMLIKALLPLLTLSAADRKTVVVNISTLGGSIGDNRSSGVYPYRTSKVALNMISKSLSIDLAPSNIIVLPLHPGHVKTDLGGTNALIDVYTSVSGLLDVIRNSDQSSSGSFFNYDGKPLPW